MTDLSPDLEAFIHQQFKQNGRPSAALVPLSFLMEAEFRPKTPIIDDLLYDRDIAMIHAARGIGKTRFCHGLGMAIAASGSFLRWKAAESRRVVFIDGELVGAQLQSMVSQALKNVDFDVQIEPCFLSSDVSEAPLPSLGTDEGRAYAWQFFEEGDVIIFDNISTLFTGIGSHNAAEDWEAAQNWLLDLRRAGMTSILVHHDGDRKSVV